MGAKQENEGNRPVTTKDRVIRVFISSTFRDMQEERDYLAKFVFPELRKMCESRGVTWGEVDLRWGVTTEQAAEGKVLPICLEEIKRCRPYFIGLLGERYDWVPGRGALQPPVPLRFQLRLDIMLTTQARLQTGSLGRWATHVEYCRRQSTVTTNPDSL